MVTKTQEAPSARKVITREDILRRIPGRYLDSVILQSHLDRELVIGAIGDRGGGKSALDAVLAIVAFAMRGKPVWSNMKIKLDLEISDALARENGLNYGGVAHYESLPLEKEALLKLDDTYRGGCLVIEEINVQYSNVRRFMTNTNLNFNEVCQQLRKFKTSLLYNVIDEMFIDPQLRGLTDAFIITYDTAFDLDSLAKHKQTGLDFNWKIYPMSGYLQGEQGKYFFTKKPMKCYFHFGRWRGIYDSMRHQEKGVYSLNKREEAEEKAQLSLESSDGIEAEMNEWAWLIENVRKLKRSGLEYLEAYQLWQILEVVEHGYTPAVIGKLLPTFGIRKHHYNKYGQWVHKIETFTLDDEASKQASDAVRN